MWVRLGLFPINEMSTMFATHFRYKYKGVGQEFPTGGLFASELGPGVITIPTSHPFVLQQRVVSSVVQFFHEEQNSLLESTVL